MRGRELVPVAEGLIRGRPLVEAAARSAVSRAYYAAFSELSDYLRVRHHTPGPRRSPHDAAWQALRSGFVDGDVARQARRRAVADAGFRLKARRQKADYRLDARLARDEATDAVHEATRIIRELDALDAAKPAN
jgi:uncharacterized protein (UPF0332 family)